MSDRCVCGHDEGMHFAASGACMKKIPASGGQRCACKAFRPQESVPMEKVAGWSQADQNADEAALRREVLSSARAYIARRKDEEAEPAFRSAHLQAELRLGWNLATSILEELEAAGELVKLQRDGAVWVPAPAAQPVGRGYALPLSQKEASALLRLLDSHLGREPVDPRDSGTINRDVQALREIRRRLKGGPL